SWNEASGTLGETDFINRGGGGQGGFYFYNIPSGGSKTLIATIDSAGTYTKQSDARLKKNVRVLEHALDDVERLRGVRFDWKRTNKPAIGVIAQEVEKVYPELVATAPDGMKTVDYSTLSAILIESTKQLRAENNALKARLDRIEARLNKQAAR